MDVGVGFGPCLEERGNGEEHGSDDEDGDEAVCEAREHAEGPERVRSQGISRVGGCHEPDRQAKEAMQGLRATIDVILAISCRSTVILLHGWPSLCRLMPGGAQTRLLLL